MKKYLVLALLVVFFASCATNISKIRNNPKKFANQSVTVTGTVNNIVNIPFTDYSFFELEDKTASIVVFTLSEYSKGDTITIKSKVIAYDSTEHVESTFRISKSISTLLEENSSLGKEKSEKTGETIGKFLSTILSKMEATYLLVEVQDK